MPEDPLGSLIDDPRYQLLLLEVAAVKDHLDHKSSLSRALSEQLDVMVGVIREYGGTIDNFIGAPVNLSARIESIAKAGQVLISGHTFREVKDVIKIKGCRNTDYGLRSFKHQALNDIINS